MTKKKKKTVRDVKGTPEQVTPEQQIQVMPGNTGVLTVRLLSAILGELQKINGGHK